MRISVSPLSDKCEILRQSSIKWPGTRLRIGEEGEKNWRGRKKKSASEANREVFRGGERVAPLGQPLADVFPI